MPYNIKMLKGLESAYVGIGSKDSNSLYFTTDGANIYLGDTRLTGKVSFTKPGTGMPGTIYVENGIPYVWDAGQYKQIIPEVVAALTASGASGTKLASEKAVVDYITGLDLATDEEFTQLQETVTQLQSTVDDKADSATTLAGYGITDAYTKGETNSAISSAVAASQHLTKVVLEAEEELPDATEATANAIYLKPVDAGSGNQYYEEFIVINDQWEKIGDTAVDLSNYVQASQITTGSANGTIAVKGSNVPVKGLGSAAYTEAAAYDAAGAATQAETNAKSYADSLASNYATAAQGTKADTALQKDDITEGSANGTIAVDGTDVAVHGLASAAYTESSVYDAAGSADAAEVAAKAYTDTALTWGTF